VAVFYLLPLFSFSFLAIGQVPITASCMLYGSLRHAAILQLLGVDSTAECGYRH